MTQCRILLVDDDPQIRAFVGAALKARKYLVEQANDAVGALEVLQALGASDRDRDAARQRFIEALDSFNGVVLYGDVRRDRQGRG